MTGKTTAYAERLSALLRERGMAPARAEELVAELTAYAAEAGSPLEEEFGPAGELADQLTRREGTDAVDGPGDGPDTWVWTADALQEVELLARFGGQGWEAERLDRLGRFVCRRDRQTPLRWSYRRETTGGRHREQLTARLATEGWELFGTWGPFAYFKRPEAAVTGPAAQLSAPPRASPAPGLLRALDPRDARGGRGRRRGHGPARRLRRRPDGRREPRGRPRRPDRRRPARRVGVAVGRAQAHRVAPVGPLSGVRPPPRTP
ncbi:hypothetical protein ACF071_20475 [Streptomyces albidoflavus]